MRDKTIELRKVRGEVNPADLFTKHLTGSDRVESLLGLFGCHFSEGRAPNAPALRTGVGHESRALLAVEAQQQHVELMSHDGGRFPNVKFEDADVPEAFEHDVSVLPHEHEDLEARFPRAVAARPPGDRDMDAEDELERTGMEIGKTLGEK